MKSLSKYILALTVFAFISMITDLSGLAQVFASDDMRQSVSAGCHSAEMPSDWEHDRPCTPEGFQPCGMCAIILDVLPAPTADKPQSYEAALTLNLKGLITDWDPGPPKTHLL